MKNLKTTLFWILAFVITAAAAVYQRTTGPTYPKRVTVTDGTTEYNLKLTRSHEGDDQCPILFEIADTSITATVEYRRYPTNDQWVKEAMQREGNFLKGGLPGQPPAGKVEYKIDFYKNGTLINNPEEFHTIVRFKGFVPRGTILYPHIFLMFFAMMLSNFAAIMALAKRERARTYAFATFIFIIIGGLIYGPILQLYAFGDLWTGIPFGWDLTDNKTLIAFLAWTFAVYKNWKQVNYRWIVVAAIVTLIIFSIPHSMFGSEFNYEAGVVTQG